MTTATISSVAPERQIGALTRITRVVKLHFANPRILVGLPWMIIGIIFVANLAVWWMIATVSSPTGSAQAMEGFRYSGSAGFIFVYMLIVAIQSMNQTFSFALGLSATRRDYYFGSALTFVGVAAMYTVGFVVFGALERATNGWGLGGSMFTQIWLGNTWYEQAFCTFVALLFFLFVGAVSGAIFVRYRAFGVTLFWCVVALALVAVAVLLTVTRSWDAFGSFFANAGFIGSFAWSLVLTAIAAVAGYFVLRRATPRS